MLNNRLRPPHKPNIQIRPRTKDASATLLPARKNHTFDSIVNVEHAVCLFNLQHHCVGKGIVVLGPVQAQDDDVGVGCVVGGADLGPGEGVIGGWE